jgi:hypothetical protein
MAEQKEKEKEKEKEKVPVRCRHCGRLVVCNVEGQVYFEPSGLDEYEKHYNNSRYILSKCSDCRGPLLLSQRGLFHPDGDGGIDDYDEAVVLFPPLPELGPEIPVNLTKSYQEALKCFHDGGTYTACAIICRRTLDGLCRDQGATKNGLQDALDELKDNGILEPNIHAWADHILRILGNDAAHDVNVEITKDDASDALEFTRAILEYVYVFKDAYRRFTERHPEHENKRKPRPAKKMEAQ